MSLAAKTCLLSQRDAREGSLVITGAMSDPTLQGILKALPNMKRICVPINGLLIPFHIARSTGDAPSMGDASPVGIHVSIHVSYPIVHVRGEEIIGKCMKLNCSIVQNSWALLYFHVFQVRKGTNTYVQHCSFTEGKFRPLHHYRRHRKPGTLVQGFPKTCPNTVKIHAFALVLLGSKYTCCTVKYTRLL